MNKVQSIIFFDGECNLCNGFVQFILKNESVAHYKFCSLQSSYAKEFFKINNFVFLNIDSVVLFENNSFYIRTEAVFKIIKMLKFPYKLLTIFRFLPLVINNFFYNLIAKYRYKLFGKTSVCWILKPQWDNRFLK
jgi:predicted DCC family thiol-disulfide oxidoreductase YuxK